jgi:hypothetical protein
LLADDVADRVVLDPAQLAGVEAARGEVVARLEEGLRAEQAADLVGAERRCRACAQSCASPVGSELEEYGGALALCSGMPPAGIEPAR